MNISYCDGCKAELKNASSFYAELVAKKVDPKAKTTFKEGQEVKVVAVQTIQLCEPCVDLCIAALPESKSLAKDKLKTNA